MERRQNCVNPVASGVTNFMNTAEAQIKEDKKPKYEAKIELNLELMRGAFEPSQFEHSSNRLSVPQGSFQLTMPDGKSYTCDMLISTHFAIVESSLSATA
jgi:hypothetical protein